MAERKFNNSPPPHLLNFSKSSYSPFIKTPPLPVYLAPKSSIDEMIQLAMDGPNVDWRVCDLSTSGRDTEDEMTLIDSSRGLNIVHYSFQRVFKKSSLEVDQIMKVMWPIFNDSPAPHELYIKVCEGEVFLLAQPV